MNISDFINEESTQSRLEYPLRMLLHLGGDLGQTETQLRAKLSDLFNAYPGEWTLYLLLGLNGAIKDAIAADTGLAWLDATVRDISVRDRLVYAVGVWQARRSGTYVPLEPKPAPLPPDQL